MRNEPLAADRIATTVESVLARQPVFDMHTHLYAPRFGSPVPHAGGAVDPSGMLLWGIDELLTYHYVVAELFRVVPARTLSVERFWAMSKSDQAELIWRELFVARSPLSEACRGVLTTLQKLGLDTGPRELAPLRRYFAAQSPERHVDRVMELSNVRAITMTNDPFDDNERARWRAHPSLGGDPRFRSVLRLDPLLRAYPDAARRMRAWGYDVRDTVDPSTIEHARRFLREWIDRIGAIYLAVSLPPGWLYPAPSDDPVARAGQSMLEEVVLPVCAERGLPFAMMNGAQRRTNPALGDAGDTAGRSDVASVMNLCARFPDNRFLVTMLTREDQHQLCIAARAFRQLTVFGCWWYVNVPSLIEEITRMRLELLGTSFVPQHSDARVLDQLVYKWDHSRRIIGRVLSEKYRDLAATGWAVHEEDIARDVRLLLHDNFAGLVAGQTRDTNGAA